MRLDHSKAKFPAPSEELFEGMARVAYREFVDLWGNVGPEKTKSQSWDSIDEDRRLVWKASMREVWKHMAIAGGAKKRRIVP